MVANIFATASKSPDWQVKLRILKAREDKEALQYLRAKFPGLEDKVFFTDYMGAVHENVIEASSVCKAGRIEHTCNACNGTCLLSDRSGKPVISVLESMKGFKYLSVCWTSEFNCRYDPLSGKFGELFKRSGLMSSQLRQTFSNYNDYCKDMTAALTAAMTAAQKQACLILGGRAGTGKTHLAVAIAIYAMKQGRQAVFRLVSELLDELRGANVNDGDKYLSLMRDLKEVPCLVLDDLSKERTTKAASDYLYQIIDYRYRRELQTIITTNAQSIEELESWEDSRYITPIVSRIIERGEWVTIANAENYRFVSKEHEVKSNAHKK